MNIVVSLIIYLQSLRFPSFFALLIMHFLKHNQNLTAEVIVSSKNLKRGFYWYIAWSKIAVLTGFKSTVYTI